jgi:hypothetical protein
MAGCTGAHAAANRGDSVIKLTQIFHDLKTGSRLDFVLNPTPIHDSH